MSVERTLPDVPAQLLPREAYISEAWLDRERVDLFGNAWTFVGIVSDFKEPGDFRTVQAGVYPLIVMRNKMGELKAFHNLCRHRGTELLEGCGNAPGAIVCPYHRWTYDLDGGLNHMPDEALCFPNIDKSRFGLKPASLGIFRGLVFVHPSAQPDESLESWFAELADVAWPHDLTSSDVEEFPDEIVYELKCNWKVFYENAIDGYHLAYLHKQTLGGPGPDGNFYEARGRHFIWYATDENGQKHRLPPLARDYYDNSDAPMFKGAEKPGYPGLYMLFPTIAILPSAYAFSVSWMEPIDANTTLLRIRLWSPKGSYETRGSLADIPGYDPESGRIKSSHWKTHPLEAGDFQSEDTWVCEKMQRSLQSPAFEVGELARSAGGEASIAFFQQSVLDFVPLDPIQDAAE